MKDLNSNFNINYLFNDIHLTSDEFTQENKTGQVHYTS